MTREYHHAKRSRRRKTPPSRAHFHLKEGITHHGKIFVDKKSAIGVECNQMPEFFHSPFGVQLSVREVVEEILRFMKEGPGRRYKVTIGTDSLRLPGNRADFVTAIVVHRVGNGGRYFWRRGEFAKLHTLRDRIIKEVLLSLEIATDLLLELREHSPIDFDFEIHADVGENGPTRAMLQEVVGMIRAHNFEAKVKPESYAASKVADRHV